MARSGSTPARPQRQPDRTPGRLSEVARQLWQAGLGSFERTRAEAGLRLEALLRDGLTTGKRAGKPARKAGTKHPPATRVKPGRPADR